MTMSNFAIIIGVDHYENKDWRLTAAVDDALAFREWALGPGEVPPENVHLLLSPTPGRELGVPYKPADSEHLIEVIQEFQDGRGAAGKRLYFYYAGHGTATPGADEEVALLPADVRVWKRDYNRLIRFSSFIHSLQKCGPADQFFFIDACRDFLREDFEPGVAPVASRWKGPSSQNAAQRRAQYLLYATSPGGRALEAGQGVFGRTLLQGLKGHPGALVWSHREHRYELRFSQLAEYVRTQVEDQVKRLGGAWHQYLQLPEHDIPPGSSGPKDCVLAKLLPEQVGKLPLRVRVKPKDAHKTCDVSVLYYGHGGMEFTVQTVKPEPDVPLPIPVELQLAPGDYTVVAKEADLGEDRQPCMLYQPRTVELLLGAKSGPRLESFSMEPIRSIPNPRTHPSTSGTPRSSSLAVLSKDDAAQFVLLDPERQAYTGFGSITVPDAPAGVYRARWVLPEGTSPERTFEVPPSRDCEFILPAPPPALGTKQWERLQELGCYMCPHGYITLSDELRPVAGLRLAPLLGLAAFQASMGAPRPGAVKVLDRLGIQPPASIPAGGSGVLVLVGASHHQPAPGLRVPEFLARSRIALHSTSADSLVEEGSFQTLPPFSAAAQWARSIDPGSWILELSLPHLAPTRYALTALRDHISILVIVADDSGEVEVQQYMAPLADPKPGIWALRDLELGERYLASGAEVPSRHLDPLSRGDYLDPLLGCIAGYSWVHEGQKERFTPILQDMLRHFDALPDAHILAGLCEPAQQEAHFQRAMKRGLPLFSQGLRALQRHGSRIENPRFAAASRSLFPGSLWTAWVER